MDLRQFRCLVAIVDEGGFSAAARRLGMTQPAVSLQIQRLEREVGDAVLVRDRRTTSLTATGEAILPHARKAIRALDEAHAAASSTRGIISGSILIGTVPGCGGADFPAVLGDFRKEYPGVMLRVIESTADDLIRRVRLEDIDIAIVGTASPSTHGLPARIITESRIVAVVASDHPLAGARSITLESLLEHELMCTPKGSGIRAAIDAACDARSPGRTVRYESGNPDVLIRFAAAGLGIAIVPDSPSLHDRDDIAVIEITDPTVSGRLELVWSASAAASPAVRELIRIAADL